MANTALNVSTGKPRVTGGIYRAPLGTALPTDATTALASAYVSLGYIATDGVTHSFEVDSGEYRAWGGDLVMAFLNSKTHRFAFGMIEVLNPEVHKTIHGDSNVTGTLTGTAGIKITADGKDMTEYVYVIELMLRDGALSRIVIPDGKITELGDVVYQDSDAINFPVTVTAQADASGNTYYEYIKKTVTT